jgi:hypothetical protein
MHRRLRGALRRCSRPRRDRPRPARLGERRTQASSRRGPRVGPPPPGPSCEPFPSYRFRRRRTALLGWPSCSPGSERCTRRTSATSGFRRHRCRDTWPACKCRRRMVARFRARDSRPVRRIHTAAGGPRRRLGSRCCTSTQCRRPPIAEAPGKENRTGHRTCRTPTEGMIVPTLPVRRAPSQAQAQTRSESASRCTARSTPHARVPVLAEPLVFLHADPEIAVVHAAHLAVEDGPRCAKE